MTETTTYTHPGQKAQPYLRPAVKYIAARWAEIAKRFVGKQVRSFAELSRRLELAMAFVALAIKTRAALTVAKDTRALALSINYRKVAPLQYVVGTNIEYAEAVEDGVKPHVRTIIRKKRIRRA